MLESAAHRVLKQRQLSRELSDSFQPFILLLLFFTREADVF